MSRIPQNFIDDLLNRVDIVGVIDSRVKLRKTGKNYSACCPFHKEKTPSFSVSPDKQFYYCFGCGATGTALGFLMEYEHLGFIDAVESLASTAGVQVPREHASSPQAKTYKDLYTILEKAQRYYESQLSEHPQRQEAVNYLKRRGLTSAVAKTFAIGYAPPGWDNLLAKLGLSEEDRNLLVESGMLIHNDDSGKRHDRFRHRIMFPILDVRGRTIGFGGRILSSDAEPTKGRGAGPKYLNSPETPVFSKGRELYGLHQALQANRKLETLLVVEGYMDVIALAQYNINNAVATLGTACGEDHLKLAFRYVSQIVFCFDGDNAGRKAAKRALENALPAMTDGRQIRFLFLPEGQDPDTLIRQIGPDRFQEQLQASLPLEEFFFTAVAEGIDVRNMDGRARMSKLAAPLLNKLPAGIYRELMFDHLARRTGLSMDLLQELMAEKATLIPPESNEQRRQTQSYVQPAPEPRIEPAEEPPAGFDYGHQPPAPPPDHQMDALADEQAVPLDDSHSAHAPAAAVKPSRTRLNPARLATTILLEHPDVLTENVNVELPDNPNSPDLSRLARLIQFLQSRPQSSFHSILGYWGGQYGLDAQRELTELVANQFLGSVRRTAPYDHIQELKDALARIRQEARLQDQSKELIALAGLASLSDEQKQRMRELLIHKQQTRLKLH